MGPPILFHVFKDSYWNTMGSLPSGDPIVGGPWNDPGFVAY